MYWQSEDGSKYLVAGRYHVHVFCKKKMEWDVLADKRTVQKNVADRRREKLKEKKRKKK
jgi:hypothetical protein